MNNVKDLQTIEETLKYLQFDNWEQSAPGLARSRELLGLLGNPEQKLKFVHIAGTNGKGSTAAMLASVLQRAGYRTGLYTSPHLLRRQLPHFAHKHRAERGGEHERNAHGF